MQNFGGVTMAKAVHPVKDWRWGVKVWRTKEIRDLISPHSKRCMVVCQYKFTGGEANAVTIPPCEYDCKVEI